MGKTRVFNPDSVALEDVQSMTPKEYRIFVFLKLNQIEGRVSRLDRRFWLVVGTIITMGLIGILA